MVIGSSPNLWLNLDFSRARRAVLLEAVKNYVKRGNGLATRCVLPPLTNLCCSMPRYITSRCKGLQDLTLSAGTVGSNFLSAATLAPNLKTLIIGPHCQISGSYIHELLDRCQNLERAEFHACVPTRRDMLWGITMKNLLSLVLNAAETHRIAWHVLHVDRLILKIPNICSLVLQYWKLSCDSVPPPQRFNLTALKNLETLDLRNSDFGYIWKLPASIKKIDVSNCLGGAFDFSDGYLKNLTWLALTGPCWDLGRICLNQVYHANTGKMTHLYAKGSMFPGMSWATLIESGALKNLQVLNLDDCGIADDVAVSIAHHCTALKSLSVSCSKVTGIGIRALCTFAQDLEYICLDYCVCCNVDAVEWARAKGVRVSFKYGTLFCT